eukprot:scaffold11332_cov94-Isochrysis_galbana.AAC.4
MGHEHGVVPEPAMSGEQPRPAPAGGPDSANGARAQGDAWVKRVAPPANGDYIAEGRVEGGRAATAAQIRSWCGIQSQRAQVRISGSAVLRSAEHRRGRRTSMIAKVCDCTGGAGAEMLRLPPSGREGRLGLCGLIALRPPPHPRDGRPDAGARQTMPSQRVLLYIMYIHGLARGASHFHATGHWLLPVCLCLPLPRQPIPSHYPSGRALWQNVAAEARSCQLLWAIHTCCGEYTARPSPVVKHM